jgi:hypothetical protein
MSRTAKNADVPATEENGVNYFNYENCKYHNVELLETEYLTAKMSNTMQALLTKGYVFPIRTRGGKMLLKEWSFRNQSYLDKHLPKEQRDPRFSITTRPKVIIKLKYSEPGAWNTVSPREFIQWNIENCKKNKIEILPAHRDNWQKSLDTLTFLKHDN